MGWNHNAYRGPDQGNRMVRIAGLASDHGRHVLRFHDKSPGGSSVSVIVADREDAAVLDEAAARGVPTEVVPPNTDDAASFKDRLLEVLGFYEFDLVCLDDYTPDLSSRVIEALPTVFELYYSLRPEAAADTPVEDILATGHRVTGCTVTAVSAGDGGVNEGIVTQEPVPVYEDDTEARLRTRLRQSGSYVAYPRAVRWFAEDQIEIDGAGVRIDADTGGEFPARRLVSDDYVRGLRYGENPHQDAAVYSDGASSDTTVVEAEHRNPTAKALSYNNYNDADAALELVREFDDPTAAVIKHTNPAGCASAEVIEDAFEDALATDPMSAYGGIVALNRECTAATAEQVIESFKEVVVAPGYTEAAVDILRKKENLRILDVGQLDPQGPGVKEKQLVGGRLVQDRDRRHLQEDDLELVTDRSPTSAEVETLSFAWHVVKHVKSNAIVFAKGTETVGIGAGQMSRVDAVRIAAMKADEHAEGKTPAGGVMASDAFFPFPDGIEHAVDAGIEAVIQPGGSVNDEDVIAAANDHDLAMVFTGTRAFRHD